jgi:exonuclease VII small subunit
MDRRLEKPGRPEQRVAVRLRRRGPQDLTFVDLLSIVALVFGVLVLLRETTRVLNLWLLLGVSVFIGLTGAYGLGSARRRSGTAEPPGNPPQRRVDTAVAAMLMGGQAEVVLHPPSSTSASEKPSRTRPAEAVKALEDSVAVWDSWEAALGGVLLNFARGDLETRELQESIRQAEEEGAPDYLLAAVSEPVVKLSAERQSIRPATREELIKVTDRLLSAFDEMTGDESERAIAFVVQTMAALDVAAHQTKRWIDLRQALLDAVERQQQPRRPYSDQEQHRPPKDEQAAG